MCDGQLKQTSTPRIEGPSRFSRIPRRQETETTEVEVASNGFAREGSALSRLGDLGCLKLSKDLSADNSHSDRVGWIGIRNRASRKERSSVTKVHLLQHRERQVISKHQGVVKKPGEGRGRGHEQARVK